MSSKKITDLTEKTEFASGDYLALVDIATGETKKITAGNFVISSSEKNNITPSGVIDGVNKTFTLPDTPSPAANLKLFLNGMYMSSSGEDYTLTGNSIVYVNAPPSGSIMRAFYKY